MTVSSPRDPMINEMLIVDVFTRLIFDAEVILGDTGLIVVELLEQVEGSLAGQPRREVSEYLRALGVDEMIAVVKQVKAASDRRQGLLAAGGTEPGRSLYH